MRAGQYNLQDHLNK